MNMMTIRNWISGFRAQQFSEALPEVEDNEMLFRKNNVCVHPAGGGRHPADGGRHSAGYLTLTAAADAHLGHTLLLGWRPNRLMAAAARSVSESAGSCGAGGPLSLHELRTSSGHVTPSVRGVCGDAPGGCGDDVTLGVRGASKAPGGCEDDVTLGVSGGGASPDICGADVTSVVRGEDVPACNGVPHRLYSDVEEASDAPPVIPSERPRSDRPEPANLDPRDLPPRAVRLELGQPEEEGRRLATQSAPPSPGLRPPAGLPTAFTVDLGRARSVHVFLTPHQPDCGQLVVCSRQSHYRTLHFHRGGLRRLVALFRRWSHLLAGGGNSDGGCHLFFVCSPPAEETDVHPEENQHPYLTLEVWQELLSADGRLLDPDRLRTLVFFCGLDARLRPVVWPLLLGVFPISASEKERTELRQQLRHEYERISALPTLLTDAARTDFQRLVVSTVDKDVVRTDPANPFFCGPANPNVGTLRQILLGFAAENPSLGYAQGMSDLLAPLLQTLPQPADAYWALDALLKRSAAVVFPRDDVMDRQLALLRELLRLLTPELYRHLSQLEDGLELLFTHRWLLLCFRREFAEPDALRIWECCWACPHTRHFSLFVCVAVCAAYAADVTSRAANADAVLLHFTTVSQHMDGRLVLKKARALLHRFLSLESVPCSLACLCTATDGGGGQWGARRVTRLHCVGHSDGHGQACPAPRR